MSLSDNIISYRLDDYKHVIIQVNFNTLLFTKPLSQLPNGELHK